MRVGREDHERREDRIEPVSSRRFILIYIFYDNDTRTHILGISAQDPDYLDPQHLSTKKLTKNLLKNFPLITKNNLFTLKDIFLVS